jgi:hypothetical protein
LFRPNLWQGILDNVDLVIELLSAEKGRAEALSVARVRRRQIVALDGPELTRFDRLSALEFYCDVFI